MITVQKARQYANLLHPAFAGYYHDGIIHESDALAAVFHLIKQGYIEPEFKNNDITQGISHLRAKARGPHHRFEQNIVRVIFYESNRVTTHYVGDLIKHGAIPTLLVSTCISSTSDSTPTLASRSQRKKVNITTVHKDNRRIINIVTREKHPYLVVGFMFFLLSALKFNSSNSLTPAIYLYAIIGIGYLLTGVLTRGTSKIHDSQVIIHPYSKYYSELYEFLKTHPPQPHTFTYEFIPYAIAFNIDTSWHADFNLHPKHEPRPKHD